MRTRRRQLLNDETPENFWPSFADLTSTIALILFVLVLLAYIQNLVSGKNLERARTQLEQTLAQLQASQVEITDAERRLKALAAEIESGQTALALSRARIEQQAEVISASSRELKEVRTKVRGIGVLRLTVLEKVKASLEAQLDKGTGGSVASIAENGNIVLDESLLFEYNSHTIKADGRAFLQSLATAFANVLSDPEVRQNIDVVLIQGHADERGSAAYNRELSARRANAVLNYMFEANEKLEAEFGRYFASSAYSKFRPVSSERSEEAYRQNRRIEISLVLKDAGVREVIDEYLRNIDPTFAPATDDAAEQNPQ